MKYKKTKKVRFEELKSQLGDLISSINNMPESRILTITHKDITFAKRRLTLCKNYLKLK